MCVCLCVWVCTNQCEWLLCEIGPVGISYSGRSMAGWKMYYKSGVWHISHMYLKVWWTYAACCLFSFMRQFMFVERRIKHDKPFLDIYVMICIRFFPLLPTVWYGQFCLSTSVLVTVSASVLFKQKVPVWLSKSLWSHIVDGKSFCNFPEQTIWDFPRKTTHLHSSDKVPLTTVVIMTLQ